MRELSNGVRRFLNDPYVREFLKLKEPYCYMAIGEYMRSKHVREKSSPINLSDAIYRGFRWDNISRVRWSEIYLYADKYLKEEEL